MLVTRLLLRRPPRIRLPQPLRCLHSQSSLRESHKEYFQNPSQFPTNFRPDRLPKDLLSPDPTITASSTDGPQPSPIRRAVRASLIVSICLILGVLTGTAVVTWDYIQPPFATDSEEHKELQEDIDDLLDTAPIVQDLRDNGWFEEASMGSGPKPTISGAGGRHLVEDTLTGPQGLTMKHFRHPHHPISTLVFFAGFGVEGWPDIVHGGTTMSVMMEAYKKMIQPTMKKEGLKPFQDEEPGIQSSAFQFLEYARPGEIYTVTVMSKGWGFGQDTISGDMYCISEAHVMLTSVDKAPTFSEIVDPDGKHGLIIHMNHGGLTLHASCNLNALFRYEGLSRGGEETLDEYKKRVEDQIPEIAEKISPSKSKRRTADNPALINDGKLINGKK